MGKNKRIIVLSNMALKFSSEPYNMPNKPRSIIRNSANSPSFNFLLRFLTTLLIRSEVSHRSITIKSEEKIAQNTKGTK